MYQQDEREYEDDYESETVWESDGTGGRRQVTYHGDGSRTEHHGGPIGDVHIEEQGGISLGL